MTVRVCLPIERQPLLLVAVRRATDHATSDVEPDTVAPLDARLPVATTTVATYSGPPVVPRDDDFVSLADYLTHRRQPPGT
jgi:hypothetical protein